MHVLRARAITSLVVVGFSCLVVPATANVYPTGITTDASGFGSPCGVVKISYVLNEAADGDFPNPGDPGVRIQILNAANSVVRTVNIARQGKGVQSYAWDGRGDGGSFVPAGSYHVRITTADRGHNQWVQISDDNNKFVRFNSPRGVAVNTNPNSPYYGRIYVSNSAAGSVGTSTRSGLGKGFYLLNADGSDAIGQVDTALTAGLTFDAASASSPLRLEVGPDDTVYESDWADKNGGIYMFDANASAGSGKQVLDGIGGLPTSCAGFPITQNLNVHGSISSSIIATGSLATGDLTVYGIDEDKATFSTFWRWSVGGGPLPANVAPTPLFTGLLVFDDCAAGGVLEDIDRGVVGRSANKWYVNQYRANNDTPCLFVVTSDGVTALWNSQATSRALLGNATAADLLLTTRAVKISPDGNSIACLLNSSATIVCPLDANGYPDLVNRVSVPTGATASGRDMTWDAAGNLYVATSGHAALRIWSPPAGPHANTTTQLGTFALNPTGSGGPTITGQPANQTACPGTTATFNITATGANPTYQWRKNGTILGGQTGTTLNLGPVVTADDGAVITVDVCDNNVVVESAPAILTVAPTIVVEPASVSTCAGQSVNFSVTARGAGTLTYQWQKDNTGNGTFANITDATASSYNETAAVIGQQYRCIVTDGCSPTNSVTSPAAKILAARPTITANPGDQLHKCQGGTATFTVAAATLSPPLSYQWTKGGVNLTDGPDANGVVISGATSSPTLTLSNLSVADDNAFFSCIVSDQCGGGSSTSLGGKLTFDAPAITVPPVAQGVYAGQTATFSVTAANPISGTLSYQWRKSGNPIPAPQGTADTLAISPALPSDTGADIDVMITNTCGTRTSAAVKLNVLQAPCNRNWADSDGDGDVDQADFGVFQRCITEVIAPNAWECKCLDRGDPLGIIDDADFNLFMTCASGPAIPADPACGKTVLFQDNFDLAVPSSTSANWSVAATPFAPTDAANNPNTTPDATVTFGFNYSALGIPSAPSSFGTTKGLLVSVNDRDDAGTDPLEAAVAFTNLAFTGDYIVQFDMWMQYDGSGTTEQSLMGIDGAIPGGTLTAPTVGTASLAGVGPVPSGYLFAVDPESGDTINRDYRTYEAGSELIGVSGGYGGGNQESTAGVFPAIFPAPKNAFAGVPGNSNRLLPGTPMGWGWARVEIQHVGGTITWKINDSVVASNIVVTLSGTGSVMLGHMDIFASVNNQQTFVVFDNVQVRVP